MQEHAGLPARNRPTVQRLSPSSRRRWRPSMNDLTRPATLTLHEEASRYALLRRLTPTLRHHMAGEFQPIGMMAAHGYFRKGNALHVCFPDKSVEAIKQWGRKFSQSMSLYR